MIQGTAGVSINTVGDIAGAYISASGAVHGFLRAPGGTITLVDALSAGTAVGQGTFPVSINAEGDVAGMYFDANNAYHGFVRPAATGTITEFDYPGAPTTAGHRGTTPVGIDAAGDVAGMYRGVNDVHHGFLRAANGTFTSFDAPGVGTGSTQGTTPIGINSAGSITGDYKDGSNVHHGFVRAANGTITTFDAPGAMSSSSAGLKDLCCGGTYPLGIDAAGDVVGAYTDASGVFHAFVRAASGTVTTFDAPGAGTSGLFPGTIATGINSTGEITGFYEDASGVFHGFVRTAGGTITSLDAPGAGTTALQGTAALGVSEAGYITGGYLDSHSVIHGFVLAPPAFLFVPVAPCRIADTRNANGAFGGPALASGSTRSFAVPSSSCGIPSTAVAYSLNVTVVPSASLGYISMWPTGQTQPLVSTLNSLDGRIKSDAAVVPAGTSGAVSVFATDATNVILDINGYFVPTTVSGALAFYPVTPCRVADTRNASGALGGPSLTGSQTRSFPVVSSSCGIPSSAQAYSLNFTAIPQGTLGYLSVWPTGQGQPLVSTLNAPTGTVTANAAIVPAGTSGAINAYVTDNTNMVIDINGYFAPPGTGGLSLYTLTPCRVLDSRLNGAPFSGVINVNVTGSGCAAPGAAQAYLFNSTVVPSGSLGYLTLWPQGAAQPLVSTLNALDGSITSNMAIVPAASGSVSAYASNPTQLILDISGYFAP